MKGTGNSGKGRFWLTLALVMTLIVIAVTISTTIGAVNVSASDIGKILVNKMSGKDIFQIRLQRTFHDFRGDRKDPGK